MSHALARPFAKSHISIWHAPTNMRVEIETDRLLICSYKSSDFVDCLALYGNNEITKYFDYGQARNKLEIEKLILERGIKYFSEKKPFGLFSIFLKKNMCFLGQIDFLPSNQLGSAEIGFILHKEFHNQGFCSEAVKALIFDYVEILNERDFTCNELPITKVIATVHPKNQSSRRVLQKAGMTLDKIEERFGQPRMWYSIPISSRAKEPIAGSL